MRYSKKSRILDIVDETPGMIEFLVDYHPLFKRLQNRLMRKTLGKFATVEDAAKIASVSLEELLEKINRRVQPEAAEPREIDHRETLKNIILDLHAGARQEDIEERMRELTGVVDATGIADLEQSLVKEGMDESEIKGLCDIHARVMGGAIDHDVEVVTPPGHPVHSYLEENKVFLRLAGDFRAALDADGDGGIELLGELMKINTHYERKENQLFPFLEDAGITSVPQVMWAVHDDIRAFGKAALAAWNEGEPYRSKAIEFVTGLEEMIYKEEKILFPMCLDTFDDSDWDNMRRGEADIGYVFIEPGDEWVPKLPSKSADSPKKADKTPTLQRLALETGMLSLAQLNLMLTHMPVDFSLVDENDRVVYYSETRHRIFPRSPAVIGRKVQNCHPPDSVSVVNEILESFRDGLKDEAEFWIEMQGKFLHIRYFAVRDPLGKYRGTLEFMQDVTRIRSLSGERRLLQWDEEND